MHKQIYFQEFCTRSSLYKLKHLISSSSSMAVAAGSSFTVVVGEDGSIFSFGDKCGQLGTGDDAGKLAPTHVAGIPCPCDGRGWALPHRHSDGYGRPAHVRSWDTRATWAGRQGGPDVPTLFCGRCLAAVLMVACGDVHTAAVEGGGVYTTGAGVRATGARG